ncbi:MAG: calcium-binding protein [Myxococcota bacterium]
MSFSVRASALFAFVGLSSGIALAAEPSSVGSEIRFDDSTVLDLGFIFEPSMERETRLGEFNLAIEGLAKSVEFIIEDDVHARGLLNVTGEDSVFISVDEEDTVGLSEINIFDSAFVELQLGGVNPDPQGKTLEDVQTDVFFIEDDIELRVRDALGGGVINAYLLRAGIDANLRSPRGSEGFVVTASQVGAFMDRVRGSGGDDAIDLGAGSDIARGRQGADVIFGGAGQDRLFGNAGADRLYGGEDSDFLHGGRGDDVLDGGPGNDVITMGGFAPRGSGQSTVIYSGGGDVVVDFDTNGRDGSEGESTFDTLDIQWPGFERVLSTGADFVAFATELESDGDTDTDAFIANGTDLVFDFGDGENFIILLDVIEPEDSDSSVIDLTRSDFIVDLDQVGSVDVIEVGESDGDPADVAFVMPDVSFLRR